MGNRITVEYELQEHVYDADEIASFEEFIEQHINMVNSWTNYAARIISGSERSVRLQAVETEEYRQLTSELHKKYAKHVEEDPGGDYPQGYWDEFAPRFAKIMDGVRDRHKVPEVNE